MSRSRLTGIGTTVVAVVAALALWWLTDGGGASDDVRDPVTRASETSSDASTTAAPDDVPATDPDSGLPVVLLDDLPPEAAEAVALIDAGGPFPYDKDGSRFGNYEGILPDERDGYYQEYTVETPGSADRGARRIVRGAEGELYWTEDHYESFERIWR